MNDAEFEELAAKVLTNEATSEEKSKLEAWLALHPNARHEFEELLTVKAFLGEVGASEPATDRPVRPIPAHRLDELQHAIRSGLRRELPFHKFWSWLTEIKATLRLFDHAVALPTRLAVASLAVLALVGVILVATFKPSGVQLAENRGSRPAQDPASNNNAVAISTGRNAAEIKNLLSLARPQFLGLITPMTMRGGEPIAVYSPRNATVSLRPPIWWKSEAGKSYSIHIEEISPDPLPPFHLDDASASPIEFSSVATWSGRTLKRDTHYLLTIQDAGDPASRASHPFQVLSEADGVPPSTSSEKIERAKQLLSYDTPCTGDALAELLTLSEESAQSEAALRLKLIAFGKLGLQQEYQQTLAQLKSLGSGPGQ